MRYIIGVETFVMWFRMDNNSIGPEGAKEVAGALKVNKTLQVIM